MRAAHGRLGLAGLVALSLLACGTPQADRGDPTSQDLASATGPDRPEHRDDRGDTEPSAGERKGRGAHVGSRGGSERLPRRPMVVGISVDGLGSTQLERLGRDALPHLWSLMDDGASTLDARTAVEMTVTLPNHTGMLTGRRIDASRGGHGWSVNVDNGGRVLDASGQVVPSIFDVATAAGRSSAVFASKAKFAVFERTWPSIGEFVVSLDNRQLVERMLQTLDATRPDLTFLHLSAPDDAGHASGWGTPAYDRSLQLVDSLIAQVRDEVAGEPYLRKHVLILLTADHGGTGREHGTASDPRNFQVPFIVAGRGVAAGRDLYDLNDGRSDPIDSWPSYEDSPRPIRNADLANLALRLLGLDPVPGSEFGVTDPLSVR